MELFLTSEAYKYLIGKTTARFAFRSYVHMDILRDLGASLAADGFRQEPTLTLEDVQRLAWEDGDEVTCAACASNFQPVACVLLDTDKMDGGAHADQLKHEDPLYRELGDLTAYVQISENGNGPVAKTMGSFFPTPARDERGRQTGWTNTAFCGAFWWFDQRSRRIVRANGCLSQIREMAKKNGFSDACFSSDAALAVIAARDEKHAANLTEQAQRQAEAEKRHAAIQNLVLGQGRFRQELPRRRGNGARREA